jgi:capsular exopolysaccharide synthesis family protein
MSKFFDALRKATEEAGANTVALTPDVSPLLSEVEGSPSARSGDQPSSTHEQIPPLEEISKEKPIRRVSPHPATSAILLPVDRYDHRDGEQYRIIRTKIVQHPERPRLLAVSSACVGDGKTVSSINIAAALSLKEKASVLLVDADFRRSSMADALGIDDSPGLAEVLQGKCSVQDAVVQLDSYPNLYVLPRGEALSNPVELLDSPRWQIVSQMFRSLFDFAVIDGPPVGLVADYDLLQASSDGVILVVRSDHTNRAQFLKVLQSVPKKKLIGVVMNCEPDWFLTKSLGHDYSYYSHDKKSDSAPAAGDGGPKKGA